MAVEQYPHTPDFLGNVVTGVGTGVAGADATNLSQVQALIASAVAGGAVGGAVATVVAVDFGAGKPNDSVDVASAGATTTQTVRAWPIPWPDADTAILDPLAVTGHVTAPGTVQLIISANNGNLVGLRKVAFQLI
jgi:hypothetical protein